MSGIEGKVVVITGASSGIGAATAQYLGERGARLVLGARRTDRLENLAARITDNGGEALAVPADVRDPDDLTRLVGIAIEQYGRLDVLFSNAGTMAVSPLDELRVDEWNDMVDVNIKGVLNGIAAALPVFRAQGSGQFIHTASTAAYKGVPHQAIYAATKTAVKVLTEGLRQEAGGAVRVTLMSPGYQHRRCRSGGQREDRRDADRATRQDRDGTDSHRACRRLCDRPARGRRCQRDRRTPDAAGLIFHSVCAGGR